MLTNSHGLWPVLLTAISAVGHPSPAAVRFTLRLGHDVIGPVEAMDVVVPRDRHSNVWMTLAPGAVARRLRELAVDIGSAIPPAAASRVGTCEIAVRDDTGAMLRVYELTGCYVARVDVWGGMHHVQLGYASFTAS